MINLSMPAVETELKPRITVFGVGGAGGNAVNNMIKSNLEGVEFVIGNTDAQALNGSLAQRRVQLGTTITRGLGAGSRPDVGRAAAEEQIDEIIGHLDGTNMVFITAGMGGGTGTGAAPVIARVARERGILTVGVVTKPFHFEGAHRMRLAESGIAELQQYVDTLIIIPNQNLFRIANEKTTFADAFKMADDVLHSGVRGVTDLMVMPGLINLDFADIRSVMTEMGKAMMGTGEATGERRSIQAAEAAISNPLLDDVSMKGARGVLINITGGYDMTLFEVDEAANRIRDEVDPDANIIFGSTFDPSLEGIMRVSVVATGIDAAAMALSRAAAVASQAQNHGQPHAAPAPAHAPAQPVHAPAAPVQALRKAPAAPPTAQARTVDYHSTLVAAPVQPAAPTPVMTAPAPAPVQPAARTHEPEPVHAAHAHDGHDHGHEAGAAPASRPEPATVTRISGPLRGERRDGVFIAPRPVESGNRQAAAVAEPAQPRQPAPAEVIDDRPRKRGLSLFERMTGWSRSGDAEGLRPIPEPAPAPAPRPQTVARPPQPAPQNAAKAAPQAPRMVHDHGDRGRSGRGEEEMLDIPAFLRRQAN